MSKQSRYWHVTFSQEYMNAPKKDLENDMIRNVKMIGLLGKPHIQKRHPFTEKDYYRKIEESQLMALYLGDY